MPIQVRGKFYYLVLSENSVLEDLMVNHLWNLGVQNFEPPEMLNSWLVAN